MRPAERKEDKGRRRLGKGDKGREGDEEKETNEGRGREGDKGRR